MMKQILVSLLLLASFSLFAANPLYKLSSMHSASGSERYSYTYDENLRMVAYEATYVNNVGTVNTGHCDISYDEAGNVERADVWNNFDGDENLNNSYTVFSYDEYDRLLSYTMVDILSDGSEHVYVTFDLTYNEDGLLDSVYQRSELGVLWELKTYSYDSLGRADVMLTFYPATGNPDSLVCTYKNEYSYNEQGLLACNSTYKWEYSEFSYSYGWSKLCSDQYDYDENGNCVEWRTADAGNNTYFKVVYHFDERLMADVAAFPSEYAVTLPKTYSNHNIACWEEDFLAYGTPLEHYDDYVFTYIPADEAGLSDAFVDHGFSFFPNPAGDVVYFNPEASVKIYDMEGKLLMTASDGSADVSGLPSGVYLIRSRNSVSKLVKR